MRRDLVRLTLLLLVLTTAATAVQHAMAADDAGQDTASAIGDRQAGAALFQRDCAVCHGPAGVGTTNGPPITEVGTAGIDFVLRTRRMPLPHPDAKVRRDTARRADGVPVEYSEQEIADIVAHAQEWVTGPEVPRVESLDRGEEALAHGGELWRRNCAACHQLAGQGGVLLEDVVIPAMGDVSPLVTAEAIRAGPGAMPAFDAASLSDRDVAELALFVDEELQHPSDPGGWAIGHFGPFAEGAVVWLLVIPLVLLTTAWIGRRT